MFHSILLIIFSYSFHSADGELVSTPQIVTALYMKIVINKSGETNLYPLEVGIR